MWKPHQYWLNQEAKNGFSPLAGIRYVETYQNYIGTYLRIIVSVPLRGLDMWKLKLRLKNLE